jgi:hypothetical protein
MFASISNVVLRPAVVISVFLILAAAATTVGALAQVPTQPVTQPVAALTISPNQLSSYMRAHAKVLGNRLLQPGNERVAQVGTLVTAGAQPVPLTVTYEISGKARIDLPDRSIGYDGTNTWASKGAVAQEDLELLEALVNDSPEYLFMGQAQHLVTRYYGPAFRFDDGKAKNYTGPYYDVHEVVDSVIGTKQTQVRIYCINSQTYTLERVQQDTLRSAKKVRIETVLGAWKYFGGQQFPTSVTRTQDGQQLFSLTITNATTGPSLPDGFLAAPKP